MFNFPTTYWSQASAVIRYIGQREGGLDKLKGKKVVHIFVNNAYGKEANPILETLARQLGFQLTLLAVNPPGEEPKPTWLQVRRHNPNWIFLSGWGVMNQVAIVEAAAIGYPMDHFIGNWWSANDADVIPAGAAAKGYIGATFHAPGTNFTVHQEIVKYVYDRGKGAGKREAVGEVLYNRGLLVAMFEVEAIRTAMTKYGNKPLTGSRSAGGSTTRAPAPSCSSSGTAGSGASSPTGSRSCAISCARGSRRRPRRERNSGTRWVTARGSSDGLETQTFAGRHDRGIQELLRRA